MKLTSKKFFLIGYYGFSNAGDEFLLKKTVALIKETHAHPRICVLYHQPHRQLTTLPFAGSLNTPYFASALLGEITLCSRRNPLRVLYACFMADTIVFGGGGIIQNTTSTFSLLYYLALIIVARLLCKPVIMLAQGIGPVYGRFAMMITRCVLKGVSSISTRDRASYYFLKKLHYKKTVFRGTDLSYYQAMMASSKSGIHGVPSIGVSLRQSQYLIPSKPIFDHFFSQVQYPLVFLALQYPSDMDALPQIMVAQDIFTEFVDMNSVFVHQKAVIQNIPLVIAMRYHAAVWASLQGIPFIALAADPKLVQLAKQLDQVCIDLSQPLADDILLKTVLSVYDQQDRYASRLKYHVPGLIERASGLADLLK